jgi:hypothetical protein
MTPASVTCWTSITRPLLTQGSAIVQRRVALRYGPTEAPSLCRPGLLVGTLIGVTFISTTHCVHGTWEWDHCSCVHSMRCNEYVCLHGGTCKQEDYCEGTENWIGDYCGACCAAGEVLLGDGTAGREGGRILNLAELDFVLTSTKRACDALRHCTCDGLGTGCAHHICNAPNATAITRPT